MSKLPKKISLEIRNVAGWRCEQCGRPCRRPGQSWEKFKGWLLTEVQKPWFEEASEYHLEEETGEWGYVDHPQRFTLTVARVDRDPNNNERANLKALCAPCQLAHNAPAAKAGKQRKRRKRRESNGQLTLF